MAAKIVLRSPRYPIIGLREAIEKAREVYSRDRRNKIPKSIVAEHLGYSGLNGASLGIVSALTKYGLLEGGRDSMWVTDRAVIIFVHEKGDAERAQAIVAAANEPELFRSLNEAFPGKASDSALRAFLVTKREFLESSAERLIRSYRETQELVEEEVVENVQSEHIDLRAAVSQPLPVEAPAPRFASNDAADSATKNHDGFLDNQPPEAMREWFRGPLSKETNYSIYVSGPMFTKEIGKLIRALQSQYDLMLEDE